MFFKQKFLKVPTGAQTFSELHWGSKRSKNSEFKIHILNPKHVKSV